MTVIGFVIADGDGSPEFLRQAKAWQGWQEENGNVVILHQMSVSQKPILERYKAVAGMLSLDAAGGQTIRQVAFFCHGWSTGIQLCPVNRVKQLALALSQLRRVGELIMTLYCCTTGSDTNSKTSEIIDDGKPGGDGGFADLLRDALCAVGVTSNCVDAHTVSGHTTENPYVRRFEGHGITTGGVGGMWLVSPKSALWSKWRKSLKGDLRWEYPFLSFQNIHETLGE